MHEGGKAWVDLVAQDSQVDGALTHLDQAQVCGARANRARSCSRGEKHTSLHRVVREVLPWVVPPVSPLLAQWLQLGGHWPQVESLLTSPPSSAQSIAVTLVLGLPGTDQVSAAGLQQVKWEVLQDACGRNTASRALRWRAVSAQGGVVQGLLELIGEAAAPRAVWVADGEVTCTSAAAVVGARVEAARVDDARREWVGGLRAAGVGPEGVTSTGLEAGLSACSGGGLVRHVVLAVSAFARAVDVLALLAATASVQQHR